MEINAQNIWIEGRRMKNNKWLESSHYPTTVLPSPPHSTVLHYDWVSCEKSPWYLRPVRYRIGMDAVDWTTAAPTSSSRPALTSPLSLFHSFFLFSFFITTQSANPTHCHKTREWLSFGVYLQQSTEKKSDAVFYHPSIWLDGTEREIWWR